jgi:hypothetical protein
LRTLIAKTHIFIVVDSPKGYESVALNVNPSELQVTSKRNAVGEYWGPLIAENGWITSARLMFVNYDTDGPI